MDERSARLAANEAVFRAGNERIDAMLGVARLFVASGHEDLTAGEVVVEEAPRFTIVEKRGAEREIVERSDPRASR